VPLAGIPSSFTDAMNVAPPAGPPAGLDHGAVVIAAITSCTNTSNPALMIAAGLLARNAVARGLAVQPWVKTSFTPGSRVVGAYLKASGLQASLDTLGFNVAGYGCATCGGFSGSLAPAVEQAIQARGLVTAAVLSGNRNFEARIHPLARASYLVSPPLVVAYALAGTIGLDVTVEPVGRDADGVPVHLSDLWPSDAEIADVMHDIVSPGLFRRHYGELFAGTREWQSLAAPRGTSFAWDAGSSYVKRPPYFDEADAGGWGGDIRGARVLLMLGDDTTTDHISPVGAIPPHTPAGAYLLDRGVAERDFNAYGARRTNHEVMVRGTFANVRLRNALVPGVEGGQTRHHGSCAVMSVHDAATRYAAAGVPLVVIAGKAYGTGSARDWAAKGTRLLGVRAVIAGGFERIHRANLAAFGVLPLQFLAGEDAGSLGLDGTETFEIEKLAERLSPGGIVAVRFRRPEGSTGVIDTLCRLDSAQEIVYWRAGGVLPHALSHLLAAGTRRPAPVPGRRNAG